MPMINVPARLLCEGKIPTNQMLERMEAAGGLAGLGVCQSGEEPECFTGGGGTTTGGTANVGAWASINDLLKLGLTIAGQAYLNNNQAKIATYGPNGTVLYQTSQIPSQYFASNAQGGNVASVGGQIGSGGASMTFSTTTLLMLVGGAVLVVGLMASRR